MAEGNRRFGEYLRALRHSKHLTLDDVCQMIRGEPAAMSRATLSDIENGKALVTMGRLVLLARVYGVRPAVLVERFETDYDLDLVDREQLDRVPTPRLLEEAKRAGMSGHVHRALLLYEQAELRALEGAPDADDGIRARARLGVATALDGAGEHHLAREVLEDLLRDELDDVTRCRAVCLLCRLAIDLGDGILARGAHGTLLELPRPWPPEITGTEPYLRARLLDLPETDDRLLQAWFDARDTAKAHGLPTVEADAMIRIARIERARGNLRSAETWAGRALELAESADLGWYRAAALMESALTLHARNRKRKAREAWRGAKALARRYRLHEVLFSIHAERWRIAVQDGDDRAARHELASAERAARYLDGIPREYRDLERALALHSKPRADLRRAARRRPQ